MRTLAFLCAVAWVSAASADFINDDFESYADTAALDAVWPVTAGTSADTFLDVEPNNPANHVVNDTVNTSRRSQSFGPYTGSLTWSYDFYDVVGVPPADSGRNYGQLLSGSGGLTELLAMGIYNAATNQDSSKYQARVAFGGPNWFNLQADRSVGWHNFTAVIGPTTVDFYVDGVLDTAGVSHAGTDWYEARIGSGLSSTGGAAYYDNYVVTPEPTSLLLLALGGLLGLRRR